ncbi:alpha/beta hydrolase fold domain-containing protein [Nocardia uniformis]|uniref:Alpha/beta hydrolase fold domain-containing protein n=1 Tax=Nocardia uniformis TaxID=53432 RepID=A0A849C3M8_9NOCA|nr:alpha/beta hydrolase fold domain-containing protein [Nocardia uniformis]NNH70945.1 alpha/beta hydrolase fold domain-containing protein [Nocardia uniformis]
MTHATTPAPENGTSVTIELPNRSTLRNRLARPLLFWTIRTGLEALSYGGKHILRTKWLFWVSSRTDGPAAILVPPRGTRRRQVRLANFRAEWLWDKRTADPFKRRDAAILYFHGGGFVSCGLNTHRRFVAKIGKTSGMPVFNVDYRQLPQAHFVDTLADALHSYEHLLAEGFPAENIILSGDSAGGGLAMRLALAARDNGLPVPGGLSLIAPWADLDWTRRNAHPNAGLDQILPPLGIETIARLGYTIDGKLDPHWSSVNHDFTGMPPILVQVGSNECLMSDAEQLAQRCAEANVPCRLQIWDLAAHVHHAASDIEPGARAAIRELGEFNRQILAARRPTTHTPAA